MGFLRKLVDSMARPRAGSPATFARAWEDDLKSVVPADEQVPDDERGLPGLREAFEQGEAEAKDTWPRRRNVDGG